MAQERVVSEEPKIVVKRKLFDVESGSGYIEVDVAGTSHKFRVFRNPKGRGYVVESEGLYESLSMLKKLLKHRGLGECTEDIEHHIRSMIYEAELKFHKRHIVPSPSLSSKNDWDLLIPTTRSYFL